VIEEKKNVAKDYVSSKNQIWPNLLPIKIENEKKLKEYQFKSYIYFCHFYITPFGLTAFFSVWFYPKCVYFIKKIFKLKSFYSINMVKISIKIINIKYNKTIK